MVLKPRWFLNPGFYGSFAGIPVGQEFLYLTRNGFRRITVPAKSCWLWPATKEGSLLSKIWTKTDLFNLSPEQVLTMVSASPVLCWRLLPPDLKVRGCPRCLLGAQRSLAGMNVLGRNYEK